MIRTAHHKRVLELGCNVAIDCGFAQAAQDLSLVEQGHGHTVDTC